MQPPVQKWSFSVLKDFEACPYRVYLSKVEQEPEPDIEDPDHPLIRGDRVHKEAEAFIRGEGPRTRDLRKFDEELHRLRDRYAEGAVEIEQKWGFTRNWEPTDFFGSDVWGRVICDVVEHLDNNTLNIDDWKTGKSWGKEVAHTQQMQLYGLVAMMRYPHITHARVNMRYLDEGKTKSQRYSRDMLSQFVQKWQSRADKLTKALTFPPKPNKGNCKFCPYSMNNGGTGACAYAVEVN
jgi:RecB family exonuclease